MPAAKKQIEEKPEVEQDLGAPDFTDLLDDDEKTLIDSVANDDSESDELTDDATGMAVGELVGMGVMFLTDYLAERRGEHWNVSTKELKQLAKAVDGSVPDTELSPAWALVAVSVGMFAPRVVVDIQLNKRKVIEVEDDDKKAD